jgi:hypothetical protein
VFKCDVSIIIDHDVLEFAITAPWCLPTFVIAKANGTIRIVTDFQKLNVALHRQQYPLPIIADILRKHPRYKFFTKLDMTKQFYTFEQEEESRQYCTISTPLGLFCYKRLPMGVKVAPSISQ